MTIYRKRISYFHNVVKLFMYGGSFFLAPLLHSKEHPSCSSLLLCYAVSVT